MRSDRERLSDIIEAIERIEQHRQLLWNRCRYCLVRTGQRSRTFEETERAHLS